jgi:hypothetical protein
MLHMSIHWWPVSVTNVKEEETIVALVLMSVTLGLSRKF